MVYINKIKKNKIYRYLTYDNYKNKTCKKIYTEKHVIIHMQLFFGILQEFFSDNKVMLNNRQMSVCLAGCNTLKGCYHAIRENNSEYDDTK